LACGNQRRPTGSGSALEALHDDALYKSTYFAFTLSGPPLFPGSDFDMTGHGTEITETGTEVTEIQWRSSDNDKPLRKLRKLFLKMRKKSPFC